MTFCKRIVPPDWRRIGPLTLLLCLTVACRTSGNAPGFQRTVRGHFDHTPVFTEALASPQAVTRACLGCHESSATEVMGTAHWTWLGAEVRVPGHEGKLRLGKRNVINNFCITAGGNERSCTKCHIGYGWADDTFDFGKAENVDCLVCHERTGAYVKGEYGLPEAGVDLLATARSVGFPLRENCLVCHAYGGGGQGVKHGDLDTSLLNPTIDDDVHMGRLGFLCIDCHTAPGHQLRGRAFSVSVENSNGVGCTDCHTRPAHDDPRLDAHLSAVACQTCHIPTYARRLPTKMFWDWSQAGDPSRPEDDHAYLKIKGAFVYDEDVQPEYGWFNLTTNRYLLGDRLEPAASTPLNEPRGDIRDPSARIWPFKVHRALQPYDTVNDILLPPITGGPGGYWATFDWNDALRRGAEQAGLPYSGHYGFARTVMYWPLSHMVAPKERALHCPDCHGPASRLDWAALGYPGDPIETGGRR